MEFVKLCLKESGELKNSCRFWHEALTLQNFGKLLCGRIIAANIYPYH